MSHTALLIFFFVMGAWGGVPLCLDLGQAQGDPLDAPDGLDALAADYRADRLDLMEFLLAVADYDPTIEEAAKRMSRATIQQPSAERMDSGVWVIPVGHYFDANCGCPECERVRI